MKSPLRLRAFTFGAAAVAVAALAPLAAADAVYHSEHLDLAPVGGAQLRSGFVENIKAEGQNVYAHEVFVLNGVVPTATYTVTRHFFFQDPECDADLVFPSRVAVLETNAAGNARGNVFVRPAEVAGFEGVHGVMWTVSNAAGAVAYQTACTSVTLD